MDVKLMTYDEWWALKSLEETSDEGKVKPKQRYPGKKNAAKKVVGNMITEKEQELTDQG